MRLAAVVLALSSTVLANGGLEGRVTLPKRAAAEGKLRLRYAGQTGAKQQDTAPAPSPAVVFVEDATGSFAPPAENPKMEQKGLAFVPRVLAVLVGTTVDFPNQDTLQHNVFSYSPAKRFDLGRFRTGESRPVTFDQPGLIRLYCEIHSHMKGFILVLKNPYFALAAEDGSYKIEGVPPGSYKLTAWQEEHEPVVVDVAVADGGATKQDFNLALGTTSQPRRPVQGWCCADPDAPPAMEIEPLPGTTCKQALPER